MKTKRKILGIPIALFVVGVLIVGGVSAALLTYFGIITTTANVEQAVTLLGDETHTIPEAAPGGESFCFLHKLRNDASVDIGVGIEMSCSKDALPDDCGGITAAVHEVPETRTLNLCAKDSTAWECISGATATLTFDPVSPTFKGTLTTTGLDSIEYALIYYPDQEDRFDPSKWNGAGGIVITTFMGVVTDLAFDEELDTNLPYGTDWNKDPSPDYCNNNNGFDSYVHCKGAKIWIVPVNDLTSGDLPLATWNPTAWLFEEDLIVYVDCDEDIGNFAVDMEKGDSTITLMTKSREKTPMLICYDFDVAIAPGTYTITTNIVPS